MLYILILTGGTTIFTSTELLQSHEAFLVSGIISVVAVLLLAQKDKASTALTYFLLIVSFYGIWFKLPVLLEGRLNYYFTKFIAFVLLGTVVVMMSVLQRKLKRSPGIPERG